MSAETKNASSILDCAECVKSGFYWASSDNDNNNCIPYRNNTMEINQINIFWDYKKLILFPFRGLG